MALRSILAAAAIAIGCASGASAASVVSEYLVSDHMESGSPEHTLWFSGNNPPGATGSKKNHFLVSPGYGKFTLYDDGSAVLDASVKNADGQGFDMLMNMMLDTTTAYDAKGPKGGPDLSTWKFFSLVSGTLTAHAGSGLADYNIVSLMSDPGKNYGIQFGMGANDKDPLMGLSSWIKVQNANCGPTDPTTGNCRLYNGDINVSVTTMPLPVGMALLPAGLGMLGALRLRKKRRAPAA